jgi:hypothetical protein
LWAAWRRKLNLLTITLVVATVSFALNIARVHSDSVGAFYSPQTRFWELLIGSTLAWLKWNRPTALSALGVRLEPIFGKIIFSRPLTVEDEVLALVQSMAGAALIVAALTLTTSAKAFPGWWALLPTLGTALLISAGPRAWVNRTILSNRILVWVGLISFPLYLWHWPLLAFARITDGDDVSARIRIACVGIAIALAWMTFWFVENPIRGNGRSAAKVTGLVVLMAAIGYTGFNSYERNGLEFRKVIKNQSPLVSSLSKIDSVYEYFQIFHEWRIGTCHAPAEGMTFEQKLDTCVEKTRPLLFMFGDSYSGMLYPGLTALQKNGGVPFGIAQFTNSNGAPFFDDTKRVIDWKANNRTLADLNEEKIRAIAATRPALVLISWMFNEGNGITDKAQLLTALELTVSKIHQASPTSKVLVIGPVPQWKVFLKDNIIAYARSHAGQLPPLYSDYGLVAEPKVWDAFLADELPKHGIEYVSAQAALCNASGCLTRTADDPHDLTTVDWGHLSKTGATFLINSIKGRIFADLK